MLPRFLSHRRIAPAVLAVYLTVATVSGLFHQHGHVHSAGCSHDQAHAQGVPHQHAAHAHGEHGKCGHHHTHTASHRHAAAHAHQSCDSTPAKDADEHGPSPASHEHCAVCQFLAEQSSVPQIVAVETWMPVTLCRDGKAPVELPAPRAADHPARGPPAPGVA